MSCFLIPITTIRNLQSIMVRFWWGSGEGNKKVHWINKDFLYKSKLKGGLGLKDLHSFNIALLAKHGWRILENPNSLLARVLKAKYFPQDDLLTAPIRSNASFVWRSIHSALFILRRYSLYDFSTNIYSRNSKGSRDFTTRSAYVIALGNCYASKVQGESSSCSIVEDFSKKNWRNVIAQENKIIYLESLP